MEKLETIKLMERLEIIKTVDTPAVQLDAETGVIEIIGKSYMEDTSSFYSPIIDWIIQYIDNGAQKTTVDLNLTYFNSTTAKYLLKILFLFKQEKIENSLTINWHYNKEDELNEERGIEMQTIVGIEFNLVPH